MCKYVLEPANRIFVKKRQQTHSATDLNSTSGLNTSCRLLNRHPYPYVKRKAEEHHILKSLSIRAFATNEAN